MIGPFRRWTDRLGSVAGDVWWVRVIALGNSCSWGDLPNEILSTISSYVSIGLSLAEAGFWFTGPCGIHSTGARQNTWHRRTVAQWHWPKPRFSLGLHGYVEYVLYQMTVKGVIQSSTGFNNWLEDNNLLSLLIHCKHLLRAWLVESYTLHRQELTSPYLACDGGSKRK